MLIYQNPCVIKIRVARKNGTAVTAKIEYESVPVLCQVCGIVGHSANKCRNKPEVSLNGEQSEQVVGGSTERVGTQNAERGRSVVWRRNRSLHRSKKSNAPESQPLERLEVLGTSIHTQNTAQGSLQENAVLIAEVHAQDSHQLIAEPVCKWLAMKL